MFVFLQYQALASLPLVLTVFVAAHNPAPFSRALYFLGLFVIAAGIAGEGLSDRPLRHFVARRAGEKLVCDEGLWGWSRHPNYFFEWLFWLAFPLFCRRFRRLLSVWVAGAIGAFNNVWAPRACVGYPAARRTYGSEIRRRLSRLSGTGEPLLSVAAERPGALAAERWEQCFQAVHHMIGARRIRVENRTRTADKGCL